MAIPVVVTESNFDSVVIGSSLPVLIDFWATWCPPCKMIAPFLEEIANEFDGKAVVCKVDVDQNQSLAMKYNVRSIPTLLFIKNGEIKDQVVGALPKAQLAQKLTAIL